MISRLRIDTRCTHLSGQAFGFPRGFLGLLLCSLSGALILVA